MLSHTQLARIDAAPSGVLGHITSEGRPNAVGITPYVVDGALVVTSTLALIRKAAALRSDPRVTVSAGGVSVCGVATVEVDRTPRYYDSFIRAQELRKFPPARTLLAVPFHRSLMPWFVGRVVIRIEPEAVTDEPCGDSATVTGVDTAGRLRTWNIPRTVDLTANQITLPRPVPDGAALLLVHEEDPAMRDLRQMAVAGTVHDGVLAVSLRRGSLAPNGTSTIGELRGLRRLARKARRNRPVLATWPQYDPRELPARGASPYPGSAGWPRSGCSLDVLSDRERDVLAEVARGKTNAEIGEALFMSPLTAKTHVSRILGKLGARDRAQLVVIGYETGLVSPGD